MSLCRMLFFATAGSLCAQISQWDDFVRELDTSTRGPDVDKVEMKAAWISKYLGKTWQRVAQRFGMTFVMPSFVDGGRLRSSNIPWKCVGGNVAMLDNAGYCSASNVISYDGLYLAYYLGSDGLLQPNDVEEAKETLRLLVEFAGNKKAGLYDKDANGNGEQRVDAFLSGYRSGEKGCLSYEPRPPWKPPLPPIRRFDGIPRT